MTSEPMRTGRRFRRPLVAASLAVVAVVALDRGLARFLPTPEGLTLPPGSRFTCATDEYRFTATVNRWGFRGPETSAHRGPGRRVLVLGDSSTFGWGVEDGEAWPAVLGRTLGEGFEVLNLGRPEAGPVDLVRVAEKALPLFAPDLVVLAIAQGDDLAQAGPRPDERGPVRRSVSGLLRTAVPGLTAWLRDRRPPTRLDEAQHRQLWQKIARRNRDEMTGDEERRFEALDNQVRAAFFEGRLDPRLVWRSIHTPAFYALTARLESPDARRALESLTDALLAIRRLADAHGARAIVLSVPIGVYSNRAACEGARRLGFDVTDSLVGSAAADDAIRLASDKAGLPFAEVTGEFRGEDVEPSSFFVLEGRLNPRGHERLGQRAAPLIRAALEPRP